MQGKLRGPRLKRKDVMVGKSKGGTTVSFSPPFPSCILRNSVAGVISPCVGASLW